MTVQHFIGLSLGEFEIEIAKNDEKPLAFKLCV
jgi:hypothetical protein